MHGAVQCIIKEFSSLYTREGQQYKFADFFLSALMDRKIRISCAKTLVTTTIFETVYDLKCTFSIWQNKQRSVFQ
jgi:hypothetical protein